MWNPCPDCIKDESLVRIRRSDHFFFQQDLRSFAGSNFPLYQFRIIVRHNKRTQQLLRPHCNKKTAQTEVTGMRKYMFDLGNGQVIMVMADNYGEAIEKAKALIKQL